MNIECEAPHQQRISDRNVWIMHVLCELWTCVNMRWMRLIMSAPHQQGDVRLGCLNHAWFLCEARCLEGQGGRVGRGDGELWEENHFLSGNGEGSCQMELRSSASNDWTQSSCLKIWAKAALRLPQYSNELQSICLPLLWQASLQTNDPMALTAPRGSHIRWWNNTLWEWWNRTKGPFFMLTSDADVHGYGWFCPNSTILSLWWATTHLMRSSSGNDGESHALLEEGTRYAQHGLKVDRRSIKMPLLLGWASDHSLVLSNQTFTDCNSSVWSCCR